MPCESCADEVPDAARFCPRCGAPVGARAAEERKIVSVLFCDLARSTELSGLLDAELLRAIMLRYFAVMREQVESHGGTVEKFIGDAVVAVFGLVTSEDDARRALAAALAMIHALTGLNGDLERDHGVRLDVRIGVHTGLVVTTASPGERQALVSGEVVNVAARLQAAAAPGQVLISDAARQSAGSGLMAVPVGPLAFKGVATTVDVFRLMDIRDLAPADTRRFDLPFVGRDHDLDMLDHAWGRVAAQGDAFVLTVLGEAGIGKTRLVTEWLERGAANDGIVGTGRCRSTRTVGSLMPLADCVAAVLAGLEVVPPGDDPGLAPAVALLQGGLLLDGSPSPSEDETCAALAHVVGAAAAERPVLLVIDDCQQADAMLIEVVGRLLDDVDRMPVMVICLARPEFTELFPGWGSGRANATTITLGRLSADESAVFAANLVAVTPHERSRLDQLLARADGNPLYLETLGALADDDQADPGQLPLSLHAFVAARIDRLDEAERWVLRHAAVIGAEFTLDDLEFLASTPRESDKLGGGPLTEQSGSRPPAAVEQRAALRALARRRLIVALCRASGLPPSYEFANAVTMRVAYESLTKQARSDAHARYAQCLAERQCSDALIADHYARAYQFMREVAAPSRRADAVRARAVGHLARAGTLAMLRVDLHRAHELLEQAVSLSDATDRLLPEYLQHLGAVCLTMGRRDEAESALLRAVRLAGQAGLPVVCAHADMLLARLRQDEAALEKTARTAAPIFTAAGDHLGLARCQLVLARACRRHGRHARALDILDLAVRHSLAAQAGQELANALGAIGVSLWYGPEPAPLAIDRCEQLLATHGSGRSAVQATLGFPLTVLYAIRGDSARAHRCMTGTLQAMSAIPHTESGVFRPLLTALVAQAENQLPVAEAALGEALRAARTAPDGGLIPRVALELAQLLLSQGHWPDAAALLDGLAIGDDQSELASYLGARAWVAAYRGSSRDADGLAAQAQTAADRTDSPIVQAVTHLARAHAAMVVGQRRRARTAASAARRQFAVKGDLSGVARSGRLLTELAR